MHVHVKIVHVHGAFKSRVRRLSKPIRQTDENRRPTVPGGGSHWLREIEFQRPGPMAGGPNHVDAENLA